MEIIFIILNKFEKASIRKRIFIFSINHEKKINNYLMGLGKLASLSTELSKKIKQLDVNQKIYMDLVKFIKPLLMFVHHLDLQIL